MTVATPLMTTEELLAMPDDGVERWLIRGELRTKEKHLTTRGIPHCLSDANLVHLFKSWKTTQGAKKYRVLTGEVRVRIARDPDTFVGIDVVVADDATPIGRTGRSTFLDGAPLVGVEILSPSDIDEEIAEKVSQLLAASVQLVWVVDPYFRTVRIHRAGAEPVMVNSTQELSADPVLPGFRVRASEVFED